MVYSNNPIVRDNNWEKEFNEKYAKLLSEQRELLIQIADRQEANWYELNKHVRLSEKMKRSGYQLGTSRDHNYHRMDLITRYRKRIDCLSPADRLAHFAKCDAVAYALDAELSTIRFLQPEVTREEWIETIDVLAHRILIWLGKQGFELVSVLD